MKNILLIVLTIILAGSVGVGSYFITKNLDSNEPNNNITNNEQNDNNVEQNNNNNNNIEQNNSVSVVSAHSFYKKVNVKKECTRNPDPKLNIKLPKINSTKANALILNQRIMNDYDYYISLEKENQKSATAEVNYNFLITGNYIFIYVNGTGGIPCGSGFSDIKSYYYDMKNDVIMNSKEAFAAAGLTIDDLANAGYNGYASDVFAACDANNINGCGCGLKIENNKLVPYYIDQCV